MNEPIVLVGVAAIVALAMWPALRWILTWQPSAPRARRHRRLGQRVRRKITKTRAVALPRRSARSRAAMTWRVAVVAWVLALGACAHELTFDRAHALGCREACARLAADGEHGSASGWYVGDHTCGCRFDDGTIDSTCERPVDGRCE